MSSALGSGQRQGPVCLLPPINHSRALQRMLDELPPDVPLRRLRQNHVHVLEDIASVWRDKRALEGAIDELLFTPKAERHGLCFDALQELSDLKWSLIRLVHWRQHSVWDDL